MVKVRVRYLTTSGLKSGVEDKKASEGKTFVVLHFVGKPEEPKQETGLVMLSAGGDGGRLEAKDNTAAGERDLWLTDGVGAKFGDWTSFWEKDAGAIAFEVPNGLSGLVFHDGKDHSYPIKPTPAPAPAATVGPGAR